MKRIQLRRTKGWRLPEGAVIVDRRTPWGNPWRAGDRPHPRGHGWGWVRPCDCPPMDQVEAVTLYHRWMRGDLPSDRAPGRLPPSLAPLRGHDLAWCPLDAPCHADVLLELMEAST